VRLALGDPLKDVQAKLGPGVAIPVVPQTNLARYVYSGRGLEIVATDRVLAVVMTGPGAALVLQARGTGGATQEIKVGMSKEALDRVVATDPSYGPMVDPEKVYRFYPAYGLVLKVKDGVVTEVGFARAPAAGPM
jgi:hypothetical protein